MDSATTLTGAGAVALALEVVKRKFPGIPAVFYPFIALLFGVAYVVGTSSQPVNQSTIVLLLQQGITVGLAAAGGYAGAKHVITSGNAAPNASK